MARQTLANPPRTILSHPRATPIAKVNRVLNNTIPHLHSKILTRIIMARAKPEIRKETIQMRMLDNKGTITRNMAISRAVTCQWRKGKDRVVEVVTMAIKEITEETTNNATKEATTKIIR